VLPGKHPLLKGQYLHERFGSADKLLLVIMLRDGAGHGLHPIDATVWGRLPVAKARVAILALDGTKAQGETWGISVSQLLVGRAFWTGQCSFSFPNNNYTFHNPRPLPGI
jgi:hypothetical protein